MKARKYQIINYILIFILLVLLACIGVLSFAAYNNQAFQRGVLRNRDSEDTRFSSNILKSYIPATTGDTKNYETVLYPYVKGIAENNRLEIPIIIANHAMNNNNLVSEGDITFDLNIKLRGFDSETKYYVNESEITNGEISFSDITLVGRKANQVQYVLGFNGKDLDKLTITVEAIPKTGDRILAAYICPCTDSIVNLFSFSGNFTKFGVENPNNHYGFNYEIFISSGRAQVTLSWDPNVFSIDQFFLNKLNSRSDDLKISGDKQYLYSKEYGTLSFIMDQVLGEDDYLVVFYPKEDLTGKDWNYIKDKVSFTAVELIDDMQQAE